MAKLCFYDASMNAGNSTRLLQAHFNYRERGMAVFLRTAALDDGSGGKPIASRIGLNADARLFEMSTDLRQRGDRFRQGRATVLRVASTRRNS